MTYTDIYIYTIIVLLGLLFGSFLNVCIYRIPRIHIRLTEQFFINLREISSENTRQNSGSQTSIAQPKKYVDLVRQFIRKQLLSIAYFWGLYSGPVVEENIPPDILAKLESLKDKEYVTGNDFIITLEEQIGKEFTDRYDDLIFKYASFEEESIVFPSSHCPHCQAPIKPWDNVPVVSFLLLQGKCRACHAKISWRYPLVELLTAALFLTVVYQFSLTLLTLVYLSFVAALIAISFIDFDHQIIPDQIALPGIVVGIIMPFFLPLPSTVMHWYGSLLGAMVGGGILALTRYVGAWVFKKEAMGGGDVKLMTMIGAFLGWQMALLTIFLGSLTGAVGGIIIKLTTGKNPIPFGPFLSFGAVITLFFGQKLLFWYLNLFFPSF